MNTIDECVQAVTDESTVSDSLDALLVDKTSLIATLRGQVATILANDNITPATQSKIDALFATAQTNAQKMKDAITANTEVPPTA